MMLTKDEWMRGAGKWMGLGLGWGLLLLGTMLGQLANAQGVSTTTVQGTVYLANGQTGAGTLSVSWPSFTTANGLAVAAGRTSVTIAPDGFMSVNLAPNVGATPAGLYYTAIYQMSDGERNTEYWVVPAAAQASLGQVRAQLMPAAQAVQAVSKSYVDQSVAELTQSLLTASGGSLSGPLYLNSDPTQALQAATKHYVDTAVNTAVPLAGGNMTGALQTPAVNGVQAPASGSAQTTLQAAMTTAGTNGAMTIPPTYAGTDGFTNPNGVRVTDLRTTGAQQAERSVKEFGAVCDGVTDDTNALQSALNYANAHGVALTIPQGTCKTRSLNWHGESIGGLGKQVSALMGFPGQDVLATVADSTNLLSYTRIHDLTIYVDQSADVSCSSAEGRATAGSCAVGRPMENNSIFSPGGNGLTGIAGTGAGWAVGNCAITMPAATGAGGNGLKVAEIENVEIVATGTDPMAAQYPGAHSTHTCGMYLGQWPQWSEFRNIDIRGLNTGIAIPALAGAIPAGLNADSNRWQNITIQATHAFTAAAGSNNVLDNVVALAGNSAATGETPTGLVLDLPGTQQGWTVRNAVVIPSWNAVQPQLTVTAASGAVTGVTAGPELGLGFDPYGTQVALKFSGSCTAQAVANVNANGSIGTVSVTQGGVGCSGTTTASVNAAGTWDTAAPVNLVGGQNMSFFAGNLLKGTGGYTVWNAAGSQTYGTQLAGGGGTLPGGGSYSAVVLNNPLGTETQVDQYPGADFGAKLQACVNAVSASYGGTCDGRNFTGTQAMGLGLTISTANTTVLLPCATIATANQVVVTAGTRNVALRGCALRGGSNASGSQGGTVFQYTGTGAMVRVGDPTYAMNTMGFHMDNVVINLTSATSATAQGLAAYRTQEMDLQSLYFLGNQNQTGMTLDGTGNYTGGTFYDNAFNGFQTAVNAVGHQIANSAMTDWLNASTFVRLHIDCPMSNGSPISGTYGINLQQGDGNTFTGGDVEGCSTALHLGSNAQNNTIVGLRNENSTNQVVADAGSAYNNWMTGGTMFTGALTDKGTRNSFMDSFHRTFNGMNGDYYGSQQDATVTNHYRIGIGAGNERGLLNRYQTDSGYRWTTGLSDATAGEQFYQVLDELNNVYRLSIGQNNNGQSSTNNQTVINAAGTGAVVVNGSNNAGTGGLVIGSGGANESTVATISNAGNAQFSGTLQVGGATMFSATPTVKNQADAEIDETLQAGLTASQKESLIYKDWNGNSQWYAEKDASNNWELNSATGGLDSIKAYQSTNSGDTYINASNSTGAVRINYETGAGTAFNIYGGSSSTLYASFTGASTIKFPGLAAGSGHNCLQIDNSGYITNTGASCSSGVGTVGAGNAGQIAYYTASGTSIAGTSTVPLTAGGTGSATATGALTNLGAVPTAGGTMTGALTAPQFNGPLTGNVTGNVSGTAANVTGTVATANGGTGATTAAGAFTNIVAPGGTLTGALTAPQFNGPLTGNVTGNATTATALAATPAQCASNKYATGVSASGAATCTQVTYTQLSGTVPTWNQNTTGTASNVTGTVATANGGTGATTAAGAFTNIVAPGGALTGALTAPQFNGPLTGNVTGNLTGNVAGNVSGNLTGNVTGNLTGNVTGNVSGTSSNVTGTVLLGNGGTGATTAAGAMAILLPGVTSDGSNGVGVAGSTQMNGTLRVGGATTFTSTPTVANHANAEVDATLWAGLTASQQESFIYKDWNGNNQWSMVKDASNNWVLNSGPGGLDSFKAYQSTNSGDTYINASNPAGVVRVNYETGAGTGFNIYGGNSSALYASFAAGGSIEFPGLAAGTGHNCLQVDSSGYITNTGSACGSASGGSSITVSSANAGSVAIYSGNGTSISGVSVVPVTSGGTGATTAAGGLASLGAQQALPGVNPDGANGVKVTGNVSAGMTAPAGATGLWSKWTNGAINPVGYGADPTGATDSNAGILAAAAAAYPSSGNKCIKIAFPAGTYLVHELDLSSYGGALCLVGDSMLYGVKFQYDGAGGSGSYLLKMAGQNYGGIQGLSFYGVYTVGSTITAHAQTGVIFTSMLDAGGTFTDNQFAEFYGDAIQIQGSGFINLYMRHMRFDHNGGYALNITSTNNANGNPAHLSDFTIDNNSVSTALTAFDVAHGYGDGVHNGMGLLECTSCGGLSFVVQHVRYEHNLPDVITGNGVGGDFYFPNTPTNGATLELSDFKDVGNGNALHPVVSTLAGGVTFLIDGNSCFTAFNGLYLNRTTGVLYGSVQDGTGTFWSFGRSAGGVQGFGIENQIFDTTTGMAYNNSPRTLGDWFFRNNLDFVPGSNGPFRVMTFPTTGRAVPAPNRNLTTVGVISTNTSGGANLTGAYLAYSQVGDNYILKYASGTSTDVNVTVTCIDYVGTGTACAGLSGQGMVVTPAPGCIALSNCPNPATVNWQQLTAKDYGMDATRMSTAPTSGTWNKGEIVWNSSPSASALGWVATASGTPGTWVAFPGVPVPSASTLGGVFTQTCTAGQHIYSINSDGSTTCTADSGGTGTARSTGSYCGGVATSSTTLTFPLLGGQTNIGTCTQGQNAGGVGFLMTGSGTLSNLTVRCNTTGVSSSSGVFTMYDQPSGASRAATVLTVTYGTTTAGTVLQDTTHTASYATGDIISVLFNTQASETLGSCAVAFNY